MDEQTRENNAALIREAKAKGKSTGFKTGALITASVGLAAIIALNKIGFNTADKATAAYDKTAKKVTDTVKSVKDKYKAKKISKVSTTTKND